MKIYLAGGGGGKIYGPSFLKKCFKNKTHINLLFSYHYWNHDEFKIINFVKEYL